MFDDLGRLQVPILATLCIVAAGCSSPSEVATGRLNESAYPPERLMAIAEVFEKQGNIARASDLYICVQKSSPELAADAEDHLHLMAQKITRDKMEARAHVVARRAESRTARPQAQAAAPTAVAQRPRQRPQPKTPSQPFGLVGYRQPLSDSNAGQEPDMHEPEEQEVEGQEPNETLEPEETPDVQEMLEPADEQDSEEMLESAEVPASEEMQPSEEIGEDAEPTGDDEPPAISEEGPEGTSEDAPEDGPGDEPADESIPSIEEVQGDLTSSDPDRRLSAAQQIARQGMDVGPILRSLRRSMQRETSELVRVQLADSILLISPHETEVVRFLLQVEKSDDLAAAALAHELLDSLIDRLVESQSAIRHRVSESGRLGKGSRIVASSRSPPQE